jgi:rhodanese-related sulfurtransferase
MTSYVTEIPAAPAADAARHFQARFNYETDCWDVHHALHTKNQDFVLVDVRSRFLFEREHVPGAVNVPHAELSQERLAAYPADALFVVYCSGPHCNGADRGALKLAQLGRPVKVMAGGIEGWRDEGFRFEGTQHAKQAASA